MNGPDEKGPDMIELPPPADAERRFLQECRPDLDLENFLARMRVFGEFLYKTNETMNLTRIPAEDFWSKHVCDSLSLLKAVPGFASGSEALCDVGCGAGFPSLVLAAAFPERSVVPMDSTGKKIAFVRQAAEQMELKHVSPVQARANELGRRPPYRNAFRYVTARAVSEASTLIRETSGLLRHGGKLIVYRTRTQADPEQELLRKSGIRFTATEEFSLPGDAGRRMFLLVEKG